MRIFFDNFVHSFRNFKFSDSSDLCAALESILNLTALAEAFSRKMKSFYTLDIFILFYTSRTLISTVNHKKFKTPKTIQKRKKKYY